MSSLIYRELSSFDYACEDSLDSPAHIFRGPSSTAIPEECIVNGSYVANAELIEIVNSNSNDTSIVYHHWNNGRNIVFLGLTGLALCQKIQ